MIFCGYQFQGKNPAYAPPTTAAITITSCWLASAPNLEAKIAITPAAIITNPGICPSTPLLQPTIFCNPTNHTRAKASASIHTQWLCTHHLGQDKSITPPPGLVIYAI